jgi:hypothetical protein
MAVDFIIKYVNSRYKMEFEPFFERGDRLFTEVDENEDWENCISWCEKLYKI